MMHVHSRSLVTLGTRPAPQFLALQFSADNAPPVDKNSNQDTPPVEPASVPIQNPWFQWGQDLWNQLAGVIGKPSDEALKDALIEQALNSGCFGPPMAKKKEEKP